MLNPATKLSGNEDNICYKTSIITNKDAYFMKKPQIQCKSEIRNGDIYSAFNLWKIENPKKTSTAVKKKSPTENCCFSMARRRCRSASPSPPMTTDAYAKIPPPTIRTQTMTRMENLTRCKKLLRCNGCPNKVLLYAEESWARTATSSYWTLSPIWWNCNRCKVVEVTGTKRYTAQAKMIEMDSGNLYIVGSFKKCADPDFKLTLTANITIADFNMGYCMTGSLERGSHKHNNYQTTHFAVVRRAEFNV